MTGTVMRYATIPSCTDLCCIVAKIDLTEIQDSSAKSHFHWKTMKCRLIIHTMQDAIIACPVFETLDSIHVIVGEEFLKTRVLQNTLKEMNVTWSMPRPVTPDIYGNCLRYTILFTLAPRWNRVGQFLINEKHFLTKPENNTAMRFNLTLKTGSGRNIEACLKLQPLKVRLCNVTLEELCIPHEVIAHFLADPNGMINVASFVNHRVTVLPSLKRGKLLTVFKKIPDSSPFKNYGELRRHWKNMYGYRLPETDDGLMYYNVYFPMPETSNFLYPNICVRSQVLENPYFGSRDVLLQSFLLDIREALPMVCGHSLKIGADDRRIEKSSIDDNSPSCSEADALKKRIEEPRTPGPTENAAATVRGYSTTRLSMSCLTPQNQIRGNTSTLMSPTPSLRGDLTDDESRTDNVRGILSTIATFREKFSSSRMQQIKEKPVEKQNQCPNFSRAGKSANLEELTKISPMEIDSEELNVFMPRSSFASKRCQALAGPSTSRRVNNTAITRTAANSEDCTESVSKFLNSKDIPMESTNRTVSQNSGKSSMREKLLRNRSKMYDETMSNDD